MAVHQLLAKTPFYGHYQRWNIRWKRASLCDDIHFTHRADCIWAERKGRKLNTLIICGTFREQKKPYTGRAAAPITNGEIGERGHFTFVFLLSTKWQYVIPVAITAMNGFFHPHKCTKTLKD